MGGHLQKQDFEWKEMIKEKDPNAKKGELKEMGLQNQYVLAEAKADWSGWTEIWGKGPQIWRYTGLGLGPGSVNLYLVAFTRSCCTHVTCSPKYQ